LTILTINDMNYLSMQIYTHILGGAVAAACVFPDKPLMHVAGAIGGFFPDSTVGWQFAVDKLKGRKPFSTENGTGFWFYTKEITHSPLWLLGLLLWNVNTSVANFFLAFTLGFALHWISDILTHCGKEFVDTDQSCAFPFFQFDWAPKLGQKFGIWEYRYNYKAAGHNKSTFAAKTGELVIIAFLSITYIAILSL
jgi:hypothetical protein